MSEVTKNLFIPTNVWYGDENLELTFPKRNCGDPFR